MENNIIMLEDENGCMVEFETIDVFELDGVTYFALIEVLPDEQDNDEVLIMKVEGDIESEEAELVMVEDEAQLEAAFAEFLKRDEEMNGEEKTKKLLKSLFFLLNFTAKCAIIITEKLIRQLP